VKSISASIIVLAAALIFGSGAHVRHSDTQIFVMIVGVVVGLIGLWGWFAGLKEK
jgi:hypothetical protein